MLKITQPGDIQPPHLQYPVAFDDQHREHANQKRRDTESYPIKVDLHERNAPLSNRFEHAEGLLWQKPLTACIVYPPITFFYFGLS